ncbi:hypothetical protein B0J11DRAFT_513956 [Dendryphion nanum]|uniref:Nucleoporin NUP37 n=1 Tax=Dendryphion nanum TaxID=256645 RepID=A0A9P9EJI2_9PLEO|nr:hypothetical protein B0J11DRAFT_513956 [Dendryphion nanum]
MKPIITTNGKLAQVRYELPHRVHDAQIYPVKAPNGSSIIIYGHETGVGIMWRGGRPLKAQVAAPAPKQVPSKLPKVNGTSSDVVMIIDSDDEDTPAKTAPQQPPQAEFEDEQEELDPDQPYPSIIQQVRLALNTSVLHIAIPQIPAVSTLRPADSVPPIFSNKIVFTVACADYSVRIITLPLSPPSNSTKEAPLNIKAPFGEEVVKISSHVGHQSIPRGIDMTWTSRNEPTSHELSDDEMDAEEPEDTSATPRARRARRRQSRSASGRRSAPDGWDILVASHSTEVGGLLKIFRFNLSETSVTVQNPISVYQTLNLRTPATRVTFNSAQYPKRRHSQLLITDPSGIARIYDPFAPTARKRRSEGDPEIGNFVALFRTTFEQPQSNSTTPSSLVARKPILDAAWASDGHSIFALLADGEWGIWDVDRSGPNLPSDPATFSVRGYVGGVDVSQNGSDPSSPKVKSGRGILAPMTPNTRRSRQENLFQGTAPTSSIPTHGAVSIVSLASSDGGAAEESVLIQYGTDIYRIANLVQFWSRNDSGSKGGLTKLHDINLLGEAITSVNQFETTVKDARLAIPRDTLISTEHRLIITTTTAQPLGRDLNADFENGQTEELEIRKTDQALLARGELDLGGMDRLLEDLEGSGSRSLALGNPRKVLFASSGA